MPMPDKIKQAHAAELQRAVQAAVEHPHPEARAMAEVGLSEWSRCVSDEEAAGVCDLTDGVPIRWVDGVGWVSE